MKDVKVYKAGRGVVVETSKHVYALDAAEGVRADYHIITHAHSDHIPKIPLGKIVMSKETYSLIYNKFKFRDNVIIDSSNLDCIELINSGHILGSRAVLIEGKILYTSDFNVYERLFLKGFKPPQAEILIIDATYAHPKFKFEEFNKILRYIDKIVSNILASGKNIVTVGHTVGKCQLLTKIFNWYENLYVSKQVSKYNRIYEKLGVNLGDYDEIATNLKTPFILIGKSSHSDVKKIVKRFSSNIIKIEFSGWSLIKKYQDYSLGIPLSDHSDYYDTLRVIDNVNPSKVYAIGSFSYKLVKILRYFGLEAEKL